MSPQTSDAAAVAETVAAPTLPPPLRQSPVASAILSDPRLSTVLNLLAETPDAALVQQCPATGSSFLFFAVQRPNDEEGSQLCAYLCAQRKVCPAGATDFHGQTALFFAARDGHGQCLDVLLANGCGVDQKDHAGQSALFYAARDGRADAMCRLLEAGANVNLVDRAGQTAIFYAAREGRTELIKEIVNEWGASATIRDRQRKSPAWYAQKQGHLELAAFLKASQMAQGRSSIVQPLPTPLQSSKGPKRMGNARQLCGLQMNVVLPSGASVWLFADAEQIKQFEEDKARFSQLAVWPLGGGSGPAAHPADGFRMEWAHVALQVVEIVGSYEGAWVFGKPVDVRAWNCGDYYQIITKPRDFRTIRTGLRKLEYFWIGEFIEDMDLVFSNCFAYNPPGSAVYGNGKAVQAFCRRVFEEHKIAHWVKLEEDLIVFLQTHGIPCNIGPGNLRVVTQPTDCNPS